MADEELVGDSTDLIEETRPEGEGEGQQPETDTPDPYAPLAQKMGWVPKSEFRGDPNDWKPAEDFILASRDINRSLSKDLRSVREEVDRISRTSAQIMADKLAERDAYWKSKQAEAIEAGDEAAAERAFEERAKLKQADPARPNHESTVQSFVRDNPWFASDAAARAVAQTVSNQLQHLPVEEQLQAARDAVHKRFPEYAPQKAKPAATVQTSQTRATNTSRGPKGFNDMPEASRKLALEYEKNHGVKKEDFAKSYWREQERKVG